VTIIALLTILTVAWVPLSLAFAAPLRLFLLLVLAGPLSIWLFSHVVNQNYRAFAEARAQRRRSVPLRPTRRSASPAPARLCGGEAGLD
jgi:hypothetical protein